jgi:hypothetical protein
MGGLLGGSSDGFDLGGDPRGLLERAMCPHSSSTIRRAFGAAWASASAKAGGDQAVFTPVITTVGIVRRASNGDGIGS